MLSKGTIVTIYEDPYTQLRREGNAEIIEHVLELDPFVNQYDVHFIGDDPEMTFTRTVVEAKCCCVDVAGDSSECKIHHDRYVRMNAEVG